MAQHEKTVCILCTFILIYTCHVFANVTLTALFGDNDEGTFQCNKKTVIMCHVQSYIAMTLKIDNIITADCTLSKCQTYKMDDSRHDFSFDTSTGIFNITIDPVQFIDNGKIFQCDDGSTVDYLTAAVKVIPDSSTTTISSAKGSHSTTITAVSGCTYPSASVTFSWFYFKVGEQPTLYKKSNPSLSTEENSCTSGPCGGQGVVKVTSTLTIHEDLDGEEHNFQVLIQHPYTTDIIVKADKRFKLKGTDIIEVTSITPGKVSNRAKINDVNFVVIMVALFLIMKWLYE